VRRAASKSPRAPALVISDWPPKLRDLEEPLGQTPPPKENEGG